MIPVICICCWLWMLSLVCQSAIRSRTSWRSKRISGIPTSLSSWRTIWDMGTCPVMGRRKSRLSQIDRLAASGIRFTSGYCSASTCTPTRYSFLTGSYAFRRPGTGVAPPNGPSIIEPGTETIASLLKKAGYQTGVIGKWHLGLGEKGTGPTGMGN